MHYKKDRFQIEVYNEGRKRRMLVGHLIFSPEIERYFFTYEMNFLHSKLAIPVGPELPITREEHKSKKGKLFPSFLDRIPDKENPAYADYCRSQGISPDEDNLIILLGTIGRRGPSTFIYEPIFIKEESTKEQLIAFRKKVGLSQWDFSQAFTIPELSISNIESGKSKDKNIIRLIDIYLNYPAVSLERLKVTGKLIHRNALNRLVSYFRT